MAYRLIATDIDGTLAAEMDDTPKGETRVISPRTLRAIARLKELGLTFTLATGRSLLGMRAFLPLVGAETPVISFNGGAVVKASGEILYERRLSMDCSRRILALGWELAPSIVVWDGDQVYTDRLSADIDRYQTFNNVQVQLVERDALTRISASKMIWFDSSGGVGKILDTLRGLDTSGFDYFTSHMSFIEFVAAGVSKGSALKKIGEILGVRREEIIAVGDGMNDLSMIEYAGLGVAMGNAGERVKAAADYVTGTVQQDGLAQVIEKFML